MIITVASFKGGVGKTTTAMHLAGALAADGSSTVLIDGDPNRSAGGWASRGPGLPFQVVDERQAAMAARRAEHVVIDTQARPSREDLQALILGCDQLIIPSTPDALALDALVQTVEELRNLDATSYRILLTMAPPTPSRDAVEARAALTEMGLPIFSVDIPRRVAFKRAGETGVLIQTTRIRDAQYAWSCYTRVVEEVRAAVEAGAAA